MVWGMVILGVVFMALGVWLDTNHTLEGAEKFFHDKGIPLNISMTIATIGVFMILFKVIEHFFFAPLQQAIDERTHNLESTFGEAEGLRTEMGQIKSDYEARLKETEASAREQIQAQIKEAQELKKSLMADAQRQADEYKQQAMAEIDSERKKAITDLRVHVTKISLAATEKILSENVDNDRNRKLIDEFLTTVEVNN